MPHACAFKLACVLPSPPEGTWRGRHGRGPALPHTVCIPENTTQHRVSIRAGLQVRQPVLEPWLYHIPAACPRAKHLNPLSIISSIKQGNQRYPPPRPFVRIKSENACKC